MVISAIISRIVSAPRKCVLCLAVFAFSLVAAVAQAAPLTPSFITLCYHNVVPVLDGSIPDDTAPVTQAELKEHFDWLKKNGILYDPNWFKDCCLIFINQGEI